MGVIKRWRKRIRTVLRGDEVERELDQELAFHLRMETEKNLRAGMSPEEARRRASIAFGGVEKFKEGVRDARTLGWTTGMALDFRLGVRMLRKYPALTCIGGFAMAFAILVGAAGFEMVTRFGFPSWPIAGPGRHHPELGCGFEPGGEPDIARCGQVAGGTGDDHRPGGISEPHPQPDRGGSGADAGHA